jgi:hypothetical protein
LAKGADGRGSFEGDDDRDFVGVFGGTVFAILDLVGRARDAEGASFFATGIPDLAEAVDEVVFAGSSGSSRSSSVSVAGAEDNSDSEPPKGSEKESGSGKETASGSETGTGTSGAFPLSTWLRVVAGAIK